MRTYHFYQRGQNDVVIDADGKTLEEAREKAAQQVGVPPDHIHWWPDIALPGAKHPDRLEIVAGKRGLDADHIAWTMFPRLTICSNTALTTTYATKLPRALDKGTRQVMEGWVEEGDILAFVTEEAE